MKCNISKFRYIIIIYFNSMMTIIDNELILINVEININLII